jgi:TusA-related sulfurtransferase
MAVAAGPPAIAVVDGTRRECAGVIAALEKVLRDLPEGSAVRALVADVPNRIDVYAWAERKGHAIPVDRRDLGRFELIIVKGGRRSGASGP